MHKDIILPLCVKSKNSAGKAEPLPFQAYYANKGKTLPWATYISIVTCQHLRSPVYVGKLSVKFRNLILEICVNVVDKHFDSVGNGLSVCSPVCAVERGSDTYVCAAVCGVACNIV